MSDPTTVLVSDWLWRGASTVFGALVATGTTIFVSRKNNEAAVLSAVTARMKLQFDRLDAEIEDVRRHAAEEREDCARRLRKMQDEIDRLMGGAMALGIPAYTDADIERGRPTVEAALRRQAKRGKPNAPHS